MEGSVDEVIVANRWLKPMQGALAFEDDDQFLYFKLPKEKLTAGGQYAIKKRGTEDSEDREDSEQEPEESEN